MNGNATYDDQEDRRQVILHALRETIAEHERTIAALSQQFAVSQAQLHAERESSCRAGGDAFARRVDLKTRLREQEVLTHSVIAQRDVSVRCLRTLMRAVERLVDLTEYSEPYDPIAVAYREARELIEVIDHQRPV